MITTLFIVLVVAFLFATGHLTSCENCWSPVTIIRAHLVWDGRNAWHPRKFRECFFCKHRVQLSRQTNQHAFAR